MLHIKNILVLLDIRYPYGFIETEKTVPRR